MPWRSSDFQRSGRLQEPDHASGHDHHKNLSEEARAELGIGGGTLRLSLGLEDVDDIAADLAAALERSGR